MSDLIKRDDALRIVDVAEDEHPYKVPGLFVTYSEYNQGWSDAVDFIRSRMEKADFVPAAPRWVRCGADRPQNRQECFVAHKGPSGFIYEHAVYYDDLNEGLGEEQFEDCTDGFVLDGDVGHAFGSIDYWMPIEPPKEDA